MDKPAGCKYLPASNAGARAPRKDPLLMPRRPDSSAKPDPKESAAEAGANKPRKWPKGGPSKADLKRYRQLLEDLKSGSVRSSQGLEREALKSSGQDFSVDHMADHGTDNFEQDFTLGLLEGKTELLREIGAALDKIDGKGDLPYGLCEECATKDEVRWAKRGEPCPWIPKGRLDVMPHARLCIPCQENEEERR